MAVYSHLPQQYDMYAVHVFSTAAVTQSFNVALMVLQNALK